MIRRMRAAHMAMLRAALILAAIPVVSACNGGGKKDDTPDPVPVPGNVAVTAVGHQRATLSWDAVTGATGYRVYVAETAAADPATITPVEVTAPPLEATGLANWQASYFRVSALDGARESELSLEVSATPTAGWLVTDRLEATAVVARYHADDTSTPVDTIPGASFLRYAYYTDYPGTIGPAKSPTGILYGIPGAQASFYDELGIFRSAEPTIVASQAGHEYAYVGHVPAAAGERLVLLDRFAHPDEGNATLVSVISVAMDGSDPRTLISACQPNGGSPFYTQYRINEYGVVFRCRKGGTENWYWSDAFNSALILPETNGVAAEQRNPKAVTQTRAIFYHYLGNLSGRMTHQTLGDGAFETAFPGTGSADLMAISPNGRLIYRVLQADGTNDLHRVNEDGSDPSPVLQPTGDNVYLPAVDAFSPDGNYFIVRWVNYLESMRNVGLVIDARLNGGVAALNDHMMENFTDARFLPDGRIWTVSQTSGVRFCGVTGEASCGGQIAAPDYYGYLGNRDGYVFANDPIAGQFISIADDGTTFDLDGGVGAPTPANDFPASGWIAYRDMNYDTWMVSEDGTERHLVDNADDTGTLRTMGVGDGNRVFLELKRNSAQRDVVLYDLDDHTATPLLVGADDEGGYFFPF